MSWRAAGSWEGVVAKRVDSLYYMGKRTREWVKIKNLLDDDCIICGYFYSRDGRVASLLLGQYGAAGEIVYKGRVTLGIRTSDFAVVLRHRTAEGPLLRAGIPK